MQHVKERCKNKAAFEKKKKKKKKCVDGCVAYSRNPAVKRTSVPKTQNGLDDETLSFLFSSPQQN